jgi:hypothetical protein
MVNIDELLDGPAAYSDITEVIEVDPAARKLHIPTTELILGVAGDDSSECKYFKMPKVIGNGIDVTDTTCSLRILYKNAAGEPDYFVVKQRVSDDDAVVFCWELERKVTEAAGDVEFSFHVCRVVDGYVRNEWHTTPAIGVVLPGIGIVGHEDLVPPSDIIGQMELLTERAETAADEAEAAADRVANVTSDGITLIDADNGDKYNVYVQDGSMHMAKDGEA